MELPRKMGAVMSDFEDALGKATMRLVEIDAELREALPELRGTLAIPGVFLGHGLGSFVARSGMSDDEIIAMVRENLGVIRQGMALLRPKAKS
jgi:hypothetical protein